MGKYSAESDKVNNSMALSLLMRDKYLNVDLQLDNKQSIEKLFN